LPRPLLSGLPLLVGPSGVARLGFLLALAVVAVDQASKWWVVEALMRPPRTIAVTPFFNLVLGWNRGVSFGLLDGDSPLPPWVLVAVALAIGAGLAVWLARVERPWLAAALGLILGGAVGNVIDRLRFGAVADFLDFHAFGYHWPAFNAADAAITVGALLVIADSLFGAPESARIKGKSQRKGQGR
jgi:signal peptidase II